MDTIRGTFIMLESIKNFYDSFVTAGKYDANKVKKWLTLRLYDRFTTK